MTYADLVRMPADEFQEAIDEAQQQELVEIPSRKLPEQGIPWQELAKTVYIGGPIDLGGGFDPDLRHAELAQEILKTAVPVAIFCPFCDHKNQGGHPTERIIRNRQYLLGADVAVFEWVARKQPTIGVPIELWDRAHIIDGGRVSVVVGELGDGIFARYLVERSVRVVDSFAEAAAVVAGQEIGS